MNDKVMSLRGEEVDFSLLRMKEQLGGFPKTEDVVLRERFIDKKRRKPNSSRKVQEMVKAQSENERSVKESLVNQRQLAAIAVEQASLSANVIEELPIVKHEIDSTKVELKKSRYSKKDVE